MLVRIAWLLAALLALLSFIAALYSPLALPLALILAAGAWGIYCGRAWSAFGLALLALAVVVSLLLHVLREPHVQVTTTELFLSLALYVGFAVLGLLAGRKLVSAGVRGASWPWLLCAAALLILPLLGRLFLIPTGAMEDTILIGDHLVVSRSSGSSPKRGDIVVFRYPIDRKQTFIKRVVAIAGDRLRIESKQLFLNGKPATEPYALHKTGYMDTYRDNFPSEPNIRLFEPAAEMLANSVVNGEVVVPQGKLFVMGDNRDSSLDSRYWGFLDTTDIIGRPLFVYFSVDIPTETRPESPPPVLLHPSWIRWSRIGKTF